MPRCAARPVVQLQHRSSSCRCHRRHEADASTGAECARAARVCVPQVWPVGLRSSTSGSSWERTSSSTGKEQLDSSLRMPQVSSASTVPAASCMDCYAGCSLAQIAITPPAPARRRWCARRAIYAADCGDAPPLAQRGAFPLSSWGALYGTETLDPSPLRPLKVRSLVPGGRCTGSGCARYPSRQVYCARHPPTRPSACCDRRRRRPWWGCWSAARGRISSGARSATWWQQPARRRPGAPARPAWSAQWHSLESWAG